jgi:hypothetical protein
VSQYDPRDAIKRTTRAMNSYVKKHERPIQLHSDTNVGDVALTSTATEPGVCVILLKSLTEDIRTVVPDDFHPLRTALALQEHVRPDGAVFLGAYELQNTPDSLCLVYGPASLLPEKAERLATLERPALMRRHEQARLGPFAAAPDTTTHSSAPLSA